MIEVSSKRIVLALAGNPNVGKSVIFNQLTGASQTVGNWPGKTVERAEGKLHFKGYEIYVLDLPGTYSLSAYSQEEIVARDYIAIERPDIVVNIVDASALERNLYLTIQILELESPVVIALNLMDVASKKGIKIDVEGLSRILGVPVIPTIAITGYGVDKLLSTVIDVVEGKIKLNPLKVRYGKEVEEKVQSLSRAIRDNLPELCSKYPARWIAVKLLERDEEIVKKVSGFPKGSLILLLADELADELERLHGKPSPIIIACERYSIITSIISKVQSISPVSKVTLSEKLDHVTTHPFLGYVILLGVMSTVFTIVFLGGSFLEELLSILFEDILLSYVEKVIFEWFSPFIAEVILNGFFTGIVAGITIAIPYVFTFYILLAILEDSGYLPRAAFLMDNLMHKIGLHGKAFIPLLLGYGCNVPACIGCRIMETDRERLILGFLAVLIPCAARTVVILGLVGKYIGIFAALLLYGVDLLIVVLLGRLLSKSLPGSPVGLIMEMPDYRMPLIKAVLIKTWVRTKDFIYVALPLIVLGSVILELLRVSGVIWAISSMASFVIQGLLGLPSETAVPLIFGILRKELTLIILLEVFNVNDFSLVLSPSQMIVFSIVTMLYIPCIATIAALVREYGVKRAFLISLLSILLALFVGMITNGVLYILKY